MPNYFKTLTLSRLILIGISIFSMTTYANTVNDFLLMDIAHTAQPTAKNTDCVTPKVNDPQYILVSCLSEGLAIVIKKDKYGFVNEQGDVVIPAKYDFIYKFQHGYALFAQKTAQSNKFYWGAINKQGKEVIKPKYDNLSRWYDEQNISFDKYQENGKLKSGLLSFTGDVIIDAIYDNTLIFYQDIARACQDKQCHFINRTGQPAFISNPNGYATYYADGQFSQSRARVKQDGLYGFVDLNGKLVIPIIYSSAENFKNKRAIVAKDERYGVIDRDNSIIVPLQYGRIERTHTGFFMAQQKDQVLFLDNDGKQQSAQVYEDILFPSIFGEFISLKKQGKWGFVNHHLQTIIPFEYQSAFTFSEELAAVKKAGKYGFINTSGDTVIPFEYDDAKIDSQDPTVLWDNPYQFKKGVAAVKKNGQWGAIDKQGKIVVPFIYDKVINNELDGIVASKDGQQFTYEYEQ